MVTRLDGILCQEKNAAVLYIWLFSVTSKISGWNIQKKASLHWILQTYEVFGVEPPHNKLTHNMSPVSMKDGSILFVQTHQRDVTFSFTHTCILHNICSVFFSFKDIFYDDGNDVVVYYVYDQMMVL